MSRASQEFIEELHTARERLIETRLSDSALTYCIAGLTRMEEMLRRPLRIVILGEYNSGKTSVADLLIGDGLLPTSVVSNTHVPVLISYAESAAVYGVTAADVRIRLDGVEDDPLTDLTFRALQIALPLERLKAYQILDTPPSINPGAFVADADIVIWCTVATRAWTESERAMWSTLPHRCCRNALLVATHKDGLHAEEEVAIVSERLRTLSAGLFRDVILVEAENVGGNSAEEDERSGAGHLRQSISAITTDITERRAQKAAKIVRRLARLTFHHLASSQLPSATAALLDGWERRSSILLEELSHGQRGLAQTIEDLLQAYAECAERFTPGVINGERPSAPSRALTSPVELPSRNPAGQRLARMLVADLTALLRMQSGGSTFTDPSTVAEYQKARSIVLGLADLDGAFEALTRMLGASGPSAQA
jgi:hypothetical protein